MIGQRAQAAAVATEVGPPWLGVATAAAADEGAAVAAALEARGGFPSVAVMATGCRPVLHPRLCIVRTQVAAMTDSEGSCGAAGGGSPAFKKAIGDSSRGRKTHSSLPTHPIVSPYAAYRRLIFTEVDSVPGRRRHRVRNRCRCALLRTAVPERSGMMWCRGWKGLDGTVQIPSPTVITSPHPRSPPTRHAS